MSRAAELLSKNPDQLSYLSGANVQLTATPDAGWVFSGWSGDASGSTNPLTVNMTARQDDHATFTQITRQLKMQTDGTPSAVVNPTGMVSVNEGDATPISVTTVPAGNAFVNWTVPVGAGNASIANTNALSTTVTLTGGNATVQANFMKFPEIVNVSIPNQSMKIGDVITASINVLDDGGLTYSLVSGSIGGYTLGNLQRVSSTLYTASFTINAGGNSYTALQNIPVSNLVLSDGTTQNSPFSKSISPE